MEHGHTATRNTPWDDAVLPKPTTDATQLRKDVDTFGFGIIEKALDEPLLSRIQERLFEQAHCEQTQGEQSVHEQRNPANPMDNAQWVNMLLNKGDVFFELVQHPLAMSIIEYMLGPDYQISCLDSQIQHPGAGVMSMHTDQWWMPPLQQPGEDYARASAMRRDEGLSCDPTAAQTAIAPPMVANVMWMITPFTTDTGATRVVPGSHLSGMAPDTSVPHNIPSIPAEGPAGTAIVFDGRLWHSAWSNTSSESRYGITTASCGPQCRPIENYSRGLRPEALDHCPPEVLHRLGLSVWSSYGHTGDMDACPTGTGEQALGPLYKSD